MGKALAHGTVVEYLEFGYCFECNDLHGFCKAMLRGDFAVRTNAGKRSATHTFCSDPPIVLRYDRNDEKNNAAWQIF
jgi:hypothetical protein